MARRRLAEYGGRLTVSDVLEQHDVHRKALADALVEGLHLNWEQLIEAAARLNTAAGAWMVDAQIAQHERDRYRLAWKSARFRARPGEPVHDELWRLLDWCFWGAGMGDVLREPLADTMTAAISDGQRADALRIMTWWTEDRGRKPIGRWQYEEDKRRIKRLALACARYRAELAEQHAVLDRQTEQLFDAIGYQPDERALLQAVRPAPAVTAGDVTAP